MCIYTCMYSTITYRDITLILWLSLLFLVSGADGTLDEYRLLSDLIILASSSLSLHSLSIFLTLCAHCRSTSSILFWHLSRTSSCTSCTFSSHVITCLWLSVDDSRVSIWSARVFPSSLDHWKVLRSMCLRVQFGSILWMSSLISPHNEQERLPVLDVGDIEKCY